MSDDSRAHGDGAEPETPHPSSSGVVSAVELNAEASPDSRRGIGRRVTAWALWDWGSASFNAVATTFVFTVYLTGKSFGPSDSVSADLGWALGIAGLAVAVFAPISAQRSDRAGRRKLWLAVFTAIVVICLALMFFVQASSDYLLLGLILLAVGTVVYEFASVNYNAMLSQVSSSRTVGKVSGFGWGMGYIGGIVLLLIVYFGFIEPSVGWFGVTSADGLSVRVSMLIAALWFAVFAIPVLLAVPEIPASAGTKARIGFFRSYAILGRDVARLWRTSRNTVYFLIASAIFRDGLTGVFTFGGVLAAGSFGFSPGEVIKFAIAANIVAGIATIAVGALDDVLGPKPVIIVSLIGLVVCGSLVFVLHSGGQTVFWIFGLALCLFVGPAQSASRSFLARVIPVGREGEVFGLYATTGRAATFLAPTAFALFVTIGGVQVWGILGIVLVLAIGLALMIPVRAKQNLLEDAVTAHGH
jgi:UMF1 family MFS transporter